MAKEVLERDESKENKIKEKEVVTAFDTAAILQGAINAKPVKLKKPKTRLDVEFFKEEDIPVIREIHKVLSAATDPVTTIEDVIPRSQRHLGKKYFDSIQSRG